MTFLLTGEGKGSRNGNDDDVDGKSISGEEDVDGVPLDGAALLKSAQKGIINSASYKIVNFNGLCLKCTSYVKDMN